MQNTLYGAFASFFRIVLINVTHRNESIQFKHNNEPCNRGTSHITHGNEAYHTHEICLSLHHTGITHEPYVSAKEPCISTILFSPATKPYVSATSLIKYRMTTFCRFSLNWSVFFAGKSPTNRVFFAGKPCQFREHTNCCHPISYWQHTL